MILMDEMIPLRLYSTRQRAYLPFNPTNKKKGAMITLLTQSMEDSITLINTPWFQNPSYFVSYWMDRNVKHYLTNDGSIKLDVEDEDPDVYEEMAFTEEVNVNHNKPVVKAYGTTNDQRLLETEFAKKNFDKWYDFFQVRKINRIYPNIYAFASLSDMNKAVGADLIEKESKITPNSFNTSTEIFVLCGSEYNLVLAEGPYSMYCETAIITYVANNSFRKCNWLLANRVGMVLSGACDYIYEYNDRKVDDRISMARFIQKYYKSEGRMALIKALKEGDYVRIFRYGAKDFYNRIKIQLEAAKVYVIEDEDNTEFIRGGDHQDAVNIFNNMSDKEKNFLDRTGTFIKMDKTRKCLYREVEKTGTYDLRGFLEIYDGPQNSGIVVIGVDPRHRHEGVASTLLTRFLEARGFFVDNPYTTNLIWYVDNKNQASIRLAKKYGFKLVRKSATQSVYRLWLYPCSDSGYSTVNTVSGPRNIVNYHEYDDIPSNILDELSLMKYCRTHFKKPDTLSGASKEHVDGMWFNPRTVKDIIKMKEVSYFHCAIFCYRALCKMGFNVNLILFREHDAYADKCGDIIAANVISYADGSTVIFDPYNPRFTSGMGSVKNVKDILTHYEDIHYRKLWGDIDKYQYMTAYIPREDEILPGSDIVDTFIKATEDQRKTAAFGEATVIETDSGKTYLPISRLTKLQINDEVIEKYKNHIEGLTEVKTKKGCHGYLWIDEKKGNIPVCYYNSQKKEDENSPGSSVVWLQAIKVADDYQGRGLASQMIEIAIDEDNITNIAVDKNNTAAQKFYEKKGFKQYVINGDIVYMQLDIYTSATQHQESFSVVEDNFTALMEGQVFVFTEAPGELSQNSYNTKLRKYLWSQRIRITSDHVAINNRVRQSCPKIKKAYVKPRMYNSLNVFYDLSYYNGLFLSNNKTIRDVAIRFYLEYLGRMLNNFDSYFKQNYVKNTIFIPVWKGAWNTLPNTDVYDWASNLNPISMIFRLIRRDPNKVRELFGGKLVIFVGKTGYFRVDFNNFEFKNIPRFKKQLGKLWRLETIEDDEEESGYGPAVPEENSSAAIAVEVIDKIEQSTKIKFDDVSAAISPNDPNEQTNPTSIILDVPQLRIRSTEIPAIKNSVAIAVVSPTQDDVINIIKDSNFKHSFGKSMLIPQFYTHK